MKTDIPSPILSVPNFGRPRPLSAPSLRIATTARNRALLRWMRAAELAAWQDFDPRIPAARQPVSNARVHPLFHPNCR